MHAREQVTQFLPPSSTHHHLLSKSLPGPPTCFPTSGSGPYSTHSYVCSYIHICNIIQMKVWRTREVLPKSRADHVPLLPNPHQELSTALRIKSKQYSLPIRFCKVSSCLPCPSSLILSSSLISGLAPLPHVHPRLVISFLVLLFNHIPFCIFHLTVISTKADFLNILSSVPSTMPVT